MPNPLKHFAAALTLSVTLWIVALAALVRMDGPPHEVSPLAMLAAIGALFLFPAMVLGGWAYASPSLPRWPKARVLFAWGIWLVPAVLTLGLVDQIDGLVISFLATLTLPLLVVTGFWWERRIS